MLLLTEASFSFLGLRSEKTAKSIARRVERLLQSADRGSRRRDLGQLRLMSAIELVHEEPGEADPGDTELGQPREWGSARPHDVDRALGTPDELTDQRVIGEPYREDAVGPRLEVETRASHSLLKQIEAIAFAAQHVDPRVQDDVDARLGRGVTDGAEAFGVLAGVEEVGIAVMVGVFEVAADGSRLQSFDQVFGREPIAGLKVGRHRDRHAPCDPGDDAERLVQRHRVVVLVAEGRGDRTARCGNDRESGLHHQAGARVPEPRHSTFSRLPRRIPLFETACFGMRQQRQFSDN
nr:hypothetical protein [Gaiella sp.]